MPTLQSMDIPAPKGWRDFETIVRDAQASRWKSTDLQKNVRPGQKQHGVDVYGYAEIGRLVVVEQRCNKLGTIRILNLLIYRQQEIKIYALESEIAGRLRYLAWVLRAHPPHVNTMAPILVYTEI